MPAGERAADAFDDDRVHGERDRAAHARVGAVASEDVADGMAGLAGRRVDVGNRAPHARLDELEPHRPFGRSEDDLVEVVLAVRVDAGEDEVRVESARASPALAGGGETAVDFVERCRRRDEERESRPGTRWARRSRRSTWRSLGAATRGRSAPGEAAGRGSR
jgi:hypothetical protein